ncbi:MAG: metal-dependent hydrolase [Vagococcus sp.]
MKVSYHGHSVVVIETNSGTKLIIDPFISGNQLCDLRVEDVSVDYILVTHGHNDHLGDTIEIAKANNATVIACPEIVHYAEKNGVKKTHGMNIGGSFTFPFGTVKMIYAQHSSGFELGEEMIYMGNPAGFVLSIEGKHIYHAGDTALFSDMSLIKEEIDIDLAFLPIGDNFTMGPKDAAKASFFIQPKLSVPIHYNTFPVIKQHPEDFIELLKKDRGLIMATGDSLTL